MVGGVAAGFADYFNVDPVFVRLGFVLLALANGIGAAVLRHLLGHRPDSGRRRCPADARW